jgi:hypothetical protein
MVVEGSWERRVGGCGREKRVEERYGFMVSLKCVRGYGYSQWFVSKDHSRLVVE